MIDNNKSKNFSSETERITNLSQRSDVTIKNSEGETMKSLYIGDLSSNITEIDLEKIFSTVGPLESTTICRDIASGKSLGYGFIKFKNYKDAEIALTTLNYYSLPGIMTKPLRIMRDVRHTVNKQFGTGNIYLKDLPLSIDSKILQELYSKFGKISSCKVNLDNTGRSLGYGFVQFENEEDSKKAIEKTNGMIIEGKKIFAGPFLSKKERRLQKNKKNGFTNIYIKNIAIENCNEKFIRDLFDIFGEITSIFIQKNKFRGIAFVNFESSEDAEDAIFRMNNKIIKNLTLYVGRAKTKIERQRYLKKKFLEKKIGPIQKPNNSILIQTKILNASRDDSIIPTIASFAKLKNCKIASALKEKQKRFVFIWFFDYSNYLRVKRKRKMLEIEKKSFINFSEIVALKNSTELEKVISKTSNLLTADKNKFKNVKSKISDTLNMFANSVLKDKTYKLAISILKVIHRLMQKKMKFKIEHSIPTILRANRKNMLFFFYCMTLSK